MCNTLTDALSTAQQQWLEGLLDPSKLSNPNPTDADKKAIKVIKVFFGSQKQWLKDVLAQVTKTCPK